MKRLPFVLDDFTRIIWNSDHARDVWQSRIDAVSNVYSKIELESVLLDYRKAYLTSLTHIDFINKQIEYSRIAKNISLIPLAKVKSGSSYKNTSVPADQQDQIFNVRCAFVQKPHVQEFAEAYNQKNDIEIGKLLGYPSCCRQFFQKYWVEEQFVDTTYPMSLGGTHGPKECNILFRWLGIRAVSHLPCSFDCDQTYQIGKRNIELGRKLGFDEEMNWLEEILDWPVQWSALHGIAEIKTPVLKISSRTDATANLVTVNKPGFTYPAEGVSGTVFPYINRAKKNILTTRSFSRSILLENSWQDNGFSSAEAMNHCHQVLIQSLKESKQQFDTVIDFGCGNAELLKRIREDFKSDVTGIEIDKERFDRIKINLTQGNFYNTSMFNLDSEWTKQQYKLALIMPGRLNDVDRDTAIAFMSWVSKNCENVLFYAYTDWIDKLFNDADSEPLNTMSKLNLEFSLTAKFQTDSAVSFLGKIRTKNPTFAFNLIGQ